MFGNTTLVNRYHDKYLEDHKDEWRESRTKLVEQFPFLRVVSHLPYPGEIYVWKNELHLDGLIYFFSDKTDEAIRKVCGDPNSVDAAITVAEDSYFAEHDEMANPYDEVYNEGFDTFEDFIFDFAARYNRLEKENEELEYRNKWLEAALEKYQSEEAPKGESEATK